jgi:enoyl-CoA hydratase/carnithine racemase
MSELPELPELPDLIDSTLLIDGRVVTLTLNRDDVRNELTGTRLAAEITAVAGWINATDEVSVLVITGAGAAFSAGGNVKHMAARSGSFGGDVAAVQEKYRRGIQRMALALHRLEVPAIAAVNGPAIGAGFDLACFCDLRIAAERASFGETFLNLGIIPGDGGAWILQRLVGYPRAAELTFSGRVFDADEAHLLGLLLEVVPADALAGRAAALAAAIAAKPPQALRLTKRLLTAARRQDLPDFLDLCAVFQGICHNSADHREAVTAFLDKRSPVFRGG